MTTGVVGAGAGAGAAEPAPFLEKTWKMLHDPDNQPYIDWTDDLTICVPKADDMAKHVLPKYFKHSNFCSFVRQLNTYGFKKIDNNPSNFEFKHEDALFRRGAKHLLLQIKRKAPNKRNVDTTQAGREGEDDDHTHQQYLHHIHQGGIPAGAASPASASGSVSSHTPTSASPSSLLHSNTPEPVFYPPNNKIRVTERDVLVEEVANLQTQHKQIMNLLLTLVDEVKDTKKKVKDMQRKYNDITKHHVPVTSGFPSVLAPSTVPSPFPFTTPTPIYIVKQESLPPDQIQLQPQLHTQPQLQQQQQQTSVCPTNDMPSASHVQPDLIGTGPLSPTMYFDHSLSLDLSSGSTTLFMNGSLGIGEEEGEGDDILQRLTRQEDVLEQLLANSHTFSPAFESFAARHLNGGGGDSTTSPSPSSSSTLSSDSPYPSAGVQVLPNSFDSVLQIESLTEELKNLANTGQ